MATLWYDEQKISTDKGLIPITLWKVDSVLNSQAMLAKLSVGQIGDLHGRHTVKSDSCNNLQSSIHAITSYYILCHVSMN